MFSIINTWQRLIRKFSIYQAFRWILLYCLSNWSVFLLVYNDLDDPTLMRLVCLWNWELILQCYPKWCQRGYFLMQQYHATVLGWHTETLTLSPTITQRKKIANIIINKTSNISFERVHHVPVLYRLKDAKHRMRRGSSSLWSTSAAQQCTLQCRVSTLRTRQT